MKNKIILFLVIFSFCIMAASMLFPVPRFIEYAGLVNQNAAGNPHADEINVNTLNSDIIYFRDGVGTYRIVSDPCVFISGKTFVAAQSQWIDPMTGDAVIVGISQMNTCEVWFLVYKVVNGDIVLSDYWGINLDIRVYP